MFKPILIYVFTSFLFSTRLLVAQGDFYSGSKCENSVKLLEDHCFTCNNEKEEAKCKVEEFKYLGEVNNQFYYSSIYLDYHPESGNDLDKEFNVRMIAIFEGSIKEKVKKVYSTGGGFGFCEHAFTELIKTKFGNFIHIYISDGNGHWDSGEYFIFKNDGWYKLDVPEISESLDSIIPKGYSFCKGGSIDLEKMNYDIRVYKPSDPCAEATGGTARAYLKITSDNKIIVTKTEYFPNLN